MLNAEQNRLNETPNMKIKCTLVGDGAVGKTSLAVSYSTNTFRAEYMPTVFEDYDKTVQIAGNKYTINCHVTAGQEDYYRLRPLGYPGTDVFLICFSVDNLASFLNVESKWIPELHNHSPNIPIILICTKIDLRDDLATLSRLSKLKKQPVSKKDGEKLAKRIKAVKYIECSSLNKEGVQSIFDEVLRIVLQSPTPKRKFWRCY